MIIMDFVREFPNENYHETSAVSNLNRFYMNAHILAGNRRLIEVIFHRTKRFSIRFSVGKYWNFHQFILWMENEIGLIHFSLIVLNASES